ncbi:MAG: ABC transporter permease, partial [Ktedonobacteraceae bacterium]|nr:ABC transporter permease [Ktedonobacteraceae bacterium]
MDISEQQQSAVSLPPTLAPTQVEVEEPLLELTQELAQKRRSQGRIIFDRFIRNKAALVGASFLMLLFLFCFLGPLIWRLNPNAINVSAVSTTLSGPTLQHPFGTDDVGRDQMARAMVGGQISLLVGFSSTLMAIVLGVGVGAFAGYYGGIIDNVLMRFTDVILAVPLYLLLFVLSASFSDGSSRSVIVLIAIFGWTYAARVVRAEF